jgi:hypothetical protein
MQSLRRFLAGSLFCLLLVWSADAQQPATPSNPPQAGDSSQKIDSETHEAAVKFVQALGVKEKMAAGIDASLDAGVEAMKKQSPNLRPEFQQEWRKRMKEQVNFDDYAAIIVHVYEKYFTAEDLHQLTGAAAAVKAGKTPSMSDDLKEKFQKNTVVIQSEIFGGTTQLGAKLGGEIGQEIAKEHPDWAPTPTQPAK